MRREGFRGHQPDFHDHFGEGFPNLERLALVDDFQALRDLLGGEGAGLHQCAGKDYIVIRGHGGTPRRSRSRGAPSIE